jgi:hypothetical protein
MNGINAIRDSREEAAKVSEIRDMMAWATRGFEKVKANSHYEPTGAKGKHQARVPKIGVQSRISGDGTNVQVREGEAPAEPRDFCNSRIECFAGTGRRPAVENRDAEVSMQSRPSALSHPSEPQ